MASFEGVRSPRPDPTPSQKSPVLRLTTLAAVVAVADQATKLWAHGSTPTWAEPVANSELALGVAGGHPLLLSALMAFALLIFGRHLTRQVHRHVLTVVTASLLLGGAAGNLIDRVLLGSVRDFIPTPWAILNLADLALLVGAIGYLISVRWPNGRAASSN